jgi:hypothetical protein
MICSCKRDCEPQIGLRAYKIAVSRGQPSVLSASGLLATPDEYLADRDVSYNEQNSRKRASKTLALSFKSMKSSHPVPL